MRVYFTGCFSRAMRMFHMLFFIYFERLLLLVNCVISIMVGYMSVPLPFLVVSVLCFGSDERIIKSTTSKE